MIWGSVGEAVPGLYGVSNGESIPGTARVASQGAGAEKLVKIPFPGARLLWGRGEIYICIVWGKFGAWMPFFFVAFVADLLR